MRRWGKWIILRSGALFLALAMTSEAQSDCRGLKMNEAGTSRADITVSSTAVMVNPANTSSCGALITNTSDTGHMRCDAFDNGVPTSTQGYLVKAGATWIVGMESQKRIDCIRVTTDVVVSVSRSLP